MIKLSKEDIILKNVDTISQYKILDYLKKHLSIDDFDIYLVDRDAIKVIDTTDEELYFNYDKVTKEVTYQDKYDKENTLEL